MNVPAIRILSRTLDLLAEVDCYESLVFARSWQGVGSFEIHAPFDAKGASFLRIGNIIMLDSDGHRSGIIRSIQCVDDHRRTNMIVKGVTLDGLAAQRITVPPSDPVYGGYSLVPLPGASPIPAETALKTFARRHMSEPEDVKQSLPIEISPDQGRGAPSMWLSRLDPLDSVLQGISEFYDIGWEVYVDLANRAYVFDCVLGTDRSVEQSTNSRVIFAPHFENILNVRYDRDITPMRNVGYAAGFGDGVDRTIIKVFDGDEPLGFDRFETYMDCGNLEIVETETALSLEQEGLHRLGQLSQVESFTATIAPGSPFKYGQQWNLGDRVTLVDRALGYTLSPRATTVSERYEAGNLGIDARFGSGPPHLRQVIRGLLPAR